MTARRHQPEATPLLSVVVPVCNEEAGLQEFHQRLGAALDALDVGAQIVYVDDGSRDGSLPLLRAIASTDQRVSVVELSRNFGKEAAISAGLDYSVGDALVLIDADLQDPPELIAQMVDHWRTGADCVAMRRRTRGGESWFKRATAAMFYRLLRRIGDVPIDENVGDFWLLNRRAADALRACAERTRFTKGMFAWVGFRRVVVDYDREARFAGNSQWNYRRLWNLAVEGITSFSAVPLKLASIAGLATAVCAFAYGLYVFVKAMAFGDEVHGYPTLILVELFLGGIQLLSLGVIGEYLSRVFVEVKRRPRYVVAGLHADIFSQRRQSGCAIGYRGSPLEHAPGQLATSGRADGAAEPGDAQVFDVARQQFSGLRTFSEP